LISRELNFKRQKTVSAGLRQTNVYIHGAPAAKNWSQKAHSNPQVIIFLHFLLETGSVWFVVAIGFLIFAGWGKRYTTTNYMNWSKRLRPAIYTIAASRVVLRADWLPAVTYFQQMPH
jgi:hypothetical protein